MLSADVPEFVPRGCQTPDSTHSTHNFEVKESTGPPQPTKPFTGTYNPPPVRSNPPFIPTGSPSRGRRERTFGVGSRAPNDSWRRPRDAFDNPRENRAQENTRDETHPDERQSLHKVREKPNPVTDDLQRQIRNKFTTPKPTYSYTKILKTKQPVNNTSLSEAKPILQEDLSLHNDSQWPTLGESLPLYKTPEKTTKPLEKRRDHNPWGRKSNEDSPTKALGKNPWQEKGAIEQIVDPSTRPRTTENTSSVKSPRKKPGNPRQDRSGSEQSGDASVRPKSREINSPVKRSTNASTKPWREGHSAQETDDSMRVKTKLAHTPLRKTETDSFLSVSRAESNSWNLPKDKSDKYDKDDSLNIKTKPASHTPLRKTETDSFLSVNKSETNSWNLQSDKQDKDDSLNIKTKPASRTPQRRTEADSFLTDNMTETNIQQPSNKNDNYDKESSTHKTTKPTPSTEPKHTHEIQSQDGAAHITEPDTQTDSDLFQWQVIGEKKNRVKKIKIRPEEDVERSQFRGLVRNDGVKYGKVLPDTPARNNTKENEENNTGKMTRKCVVDLAKSKGAHSLSPQESQGAIRRDTVAGKSSPKEKRKARPTKVMSLAIVSSDKKETRPSLKPPTTATTTATATPAVVKKPLSEEALQKKLAFKLMKKEEKIKKREMKARQALMAPKNSKVSFITTSFLEKTQMASQASAQHSTQMNFTFEEYPSLQAQRNVPLRRDALQNIPAPHTGITQTPRHLVNINEPSAQPAIDIPKNSNHKSVKANQTSSVKTGLKSDDLLSGLIPVSSNDDGGDGDVDGYAITYRKALLSAKAKRMVAKQDLRHSHLPTKPPIDTPPPKKQIKTKDPLLLNLQALAVKCRNKKREGAYMDEKYSSAKRMDNREDEHPGRKTGTHTVPKAAGVVVKRGKINAKKSIKKKISRVKRCKMENQQREALALQLLLAQASIIQQQQQQQPQELLKPPPTDDNKTENTEGESNPRDKETNDPLSTTTITENDKRTPQNETAPSIETKSRDGTETESKEDRNETRSREDGIEIKSKDETETKSKDETEIKSKDETETKSKDETETKSRDETEIKSKEDRTETKNIVERESDIETQLLFTTKIKSDKEQTKPNKTEQDEKPKSNQERTEEKTEDPDENKENESLSNDQHTSTNINTEVTKTEGDEKPKTLWKVTGLQITAEENRDLEIKDEKDGERMEKEKDGEGKEKDGEGKTSEHSIQDDPMCSNSADQLKLLTDDPVIAKKASDLIQLIKAQKHRPSGLREYCHQVVTREVNAVAKELISTLMTFQKRHYQRDPTKARIRKRYVCGLKETTKLMGRMSCVIMAPNIQQCEGQGSLDDAVEKLLNQAEKLKVPVVFALSTKEMKYLCRKSSRKVSCFGIINYQGAQDLFQRLMQLMPEAQKQYQQLVVSGQCRVPKEGEEEEEEEDQEEGQDESPKDLNFEVLNRTKALLMAP